MANRPLRECAQINCHNLTTMTYCKEHRKPAFGDTERPSACKRGYDNKWGKARKGFLQKHPFCEECLAEGKKIIATIVHHKIAHKGDRDLFWDRNNWQPLCTYHHTKHTARGE